MSDYFKIVGFFFLSIPLLVLSVASIGVPIILAGNYDNGWFLLLWLLVPFPFAALCKMME